MAKKTDVVEIGGPFSDRVTVQFEGDVAVVSIRVPARDLREKLKKERALNHPVDLCVKDLVRHAMERAIVRGNTGRRLLDLSEAELARNDQRPLFPVHNGADVAAER